MVRVVNWPWEEGGWKKSTNSGCSEVAGEGEGELPGVALLYEWGGSFLRCQMSLGASLV